MNRKLLKKNINNLTCLWQIMGAQTPVFAAGSNDIFASSRWPNRCWLDAFSSGERALFFAQHLNALPAHIMVPVWGINAENDNLLEAALQAKGFLPVLMQTGMYLNLADSNHNTACAQEIHNVETPAQIAEWTHIASTSFGYDIDEPVIATLPKQPDIELLLVHDIENKIAPAAEKFDQPQGIATALLLTTGDTLGVHMVGVLPNGRGRGIAMQLMQAIIGKAKQQGCKTITLQASKAGEGIYRKLGFQAHFAMRCFKKPAVQIPAQ